jgi:hypothetical protein
MSICARKNSLSYSFFPPLPPFPGWFLEKNADWVTFPAEDYHIAILIGQVFSRWPFGGKGGSMLRTAMGLGVVVILLAAAGCTMCCHPYDNCGPIYDGNGCQSCESRSRLGSVLSGSPELTLTPELAKRPVQGKTASSAPARGHMQGQSASFGIVGGRVQGRTQGQVQTGDVPGSEKIVSVTDRVVDSTQPAADQSQQAAVEPSIESPTPSTSKGWTARRPTPELQR